MLSQKTIDVVKSTIPALSEHSVALTTLFYEKMFENNPEVKPLFNSSNQSGGRQQKALAGAIVAFAQNVDNVPALTSAVELIAQKHASLMIQAEHYPIVGANLLASIQELLGLNPEHEIITAWAQAYGFLAGVLMNREAEIYASKDNQNGGWTGFRPFRVVKRIKESSVITSFYLEPEDGKMIPTYLPGQYLTVRVPTPEGQTTMRNYSLSGKSSDQQFRISVKREAGREGVQPPGFVSNYLHTSLKEGETLEVGPPCGEFVLDDEVHSKKPLVFLAAGIGITPLLSMVSTALDKDPNREAIFVHASLNEQVQAFRSTLDDLANKHSSLTLRYRYAEESSDRDISEIISTGLTDEPFLASLINNRDANYFICGPDGFMNAMSGLLSNWGIPSDQVRLEAFGPKVG